MSVFRVKVYAGGLAGGALGGWFIGEHLRGMFWPWMLLFLAVVVYTIVMLDREK